MSIFWQVLLALIAFFVVLPALGAVLVGIRWLFRGTSKPEAPKPYVPLLKRIDRNSWIVIALVAALIIAVNIADYIGHH